MSKSSPAKGSNWTCTILWGNLLLMPVDFSCGAAGRKFSQNHTLGDELCHYKIRTLSLSLSVCIFMISYDRYDFILYCVRHIHIVIIHIYTLYIGLLENNGSRNRKIPIWIHLAFQAFVRDTSEFSLLISSPVQCPNLT